MADGLFIGKGSDGSAFLFDGELGWDLPDLVRSPSGDWSVGLPPAESLRDGSIVEVTDPNERAMLMKEARAAASSMPNLAKAA